MDWSDTHFAKSCTAHLKSTVSELRDYLPAAEIAELPIA